MTLRLSLATRLSAIVLVSLAAVWIVAAAVHYRSSEAGRNAAWPPPAQVVALVDLLERTAPDARADVLEAVHSTVLQAALDPAGTAATDHSVLSPDPARIASYATALGDRPLSVSLVGASGEPLHFAPRLLAGTDALRFRVGLRDGTVLILDTRSPLAVSRLGLPVGFGAGLFGTLVALVALAILNREMQPIARLAAAVDRLDPTEAPVSLQASRRDSPEVHALVAAFDRLQERLAVLLRARMAMLGGISHDVRTFAARLRLRLDAISDDDERVRGERDIADMIRLLDDALLASRAGASELTQELVEFDAVVRSEVEDRLAHGATIDLQMEAEDAVVLGDRLALRRVVANLVDNALAYGRAAHLRLTTSWDAVELTVDDEGAGIPESARTLLMEPFTRADSSRSRGTGGAGLGLAIVRSLIDAHEGLVSITDAPSGGARLRVRLKLYAPNR